MIDWPCAFGGPKATANYRAEPEHFQVDEITELTPTGDGDYLLLKVQKKNIDTAAVASELAKYYSVKPRAVSYAGRKDKQAVTTQWFSVQTNADWTNNASPDHAKFSIIASARHQHKLAIGGLTGNRFTIRCTDFQGSRSDTETILTQITRYGIPNYFGPQRFGSKNQNLIRGKRMLAGELRVREKNQRSMYLSACRSFLFNEILAEHIKRNSWQSGRGLLPGDGPIPIDGTGKEIIASVLLRHEALARGIANSRVAWHERPLVVHADELSYCWDNGALVLSFSLPKGAFATSLLRELLA